MSTPRLTPEMMVAGMAAGRKILLGYSKLASDAISDSELYFIVETVSIAMLAAQDAEQDQS